MFQVQHFRQAVLPICRPPSPSPSESLEEGQRQHRKTRYLSVRCKVASDVRFAIKYGDGPCPLRLRKAVCRSKARTPYCGGASSLVTPEPCQPAS